MDQGLDGALVRGRGGGRSWTRMRSASGSRWSGVDRSRVYSGTAAAQGRMFTGA
ncbi:hypothetical protein ACFSHP_09340 [Novosphingobium panipatense]